MNTFDDPAPMARPTPAELDAYRSQSVVSDPGEHGDWLDAVRPDPASMRETAVALVHHYRAFGDPAEQGFAPERIDEIDLRYADTILGRLRELDPTPPPAARAATDTVLGCCRDHTLLMLTQLRRRGVPARARVGFAGYFVDPWMLDHVVAEVWDAEQDRWRLMDCDVPDGHRDASTGELLDLTDVPRDRFVVGAKAWQLARAGGDDAQRFAVGPDVPIPFLRGFHQIAYDMLLDLASLAKHEMLQWDGWGILDQIDVDDPEMLVTFDDVAATLEDPAAPLAEVLDLFADDRFRVPSTITVQSPLGAEPRQVPLRTQPDLTEPDLTAPATAGG